MAPPTTTTTTTTSTPSFSSSLSSSCSSSPSSLSSLLSVLDVRSNRCALLIRGGSSSGDDNNNKNKTKNTKDLSLSSSSSSSSSWFRDFLNKNEYYDGALRSLVDALLPAADSIPEMDSVWTNPIAQITNPAGFWTFRVSYDPGFWTCLEQRLEQYYASFSSSTAAAAAAAENNRNNNNNRNKNSPLVVLSPHLLQTLLHALSTGEGLLPYTTNTIPFCEWSKEEQQEWLEVMLSSSSPTTPTASKNKSVVQQQQQHHQNIQSALRQLYPLIAETAFTYYPAMSTHTVPMATRTTTTTLLKSSSSSMQQQQQLSPQSAAVLKNWNPFWKTMGYPGTAAMSLGRIQDAHALVTSRRNHQQQQQQQYNTHFMTYDDHLLPPRPPQLVLPLEQETTTETTAETVLLECDVVIVGSGVAGSVTAALLSQAGYHVVVVEQGPRPIDSIVDTEQAVDFQWKQHRQYPAHIQLQQQQQQQQQQQDNGSSSKTNNNNGAANASTRILLQVTTARVVGGSAMYHSGACPILPLSIQKQWFDEYALDDFSLYGPYATSLQQVLERLNLMVVPKNHNNIANDKLRQACILFGIAYKQMAQNIRPRHDSSYSYSLDSTTTTTDTATADTCGFVAIGCDRYGQRTTPSLVYLQDAARTGNCQLIDQATVTRILTTALPPRTRFSSSSTANKIATGVLCQDTRTNGGGRLFEVRAHRAVIVTAGAMETPRLLHQSGISHTNPHLGRHLKLQPAIAVLGFPTTTKNNDDNNNKPPFAAVNAHLGLAQTITAFVGGGGAGDSSESPATAMIQATTLHPGWMARHLASVSNCTPPRSLKSKMRQFRNCVPFICTVRDDTSHGRIILHNNNRNRNNNNNNNHYSMLEYTLSGPDQESLRQAMVTATRMQWATGSQHVSIGTEDYTTTTTTATATELAMSSSLSLFSTSQSGTCRMSAVPNQGVVDCFTAQVWDVHQLHVLDASCFPTATLVNPMITVVAFAHMWTTKLIQSWKQAPTPSTAAQATTTTTTTTTTTLGIGVLLKWILGLLAWIAFLLFGWLDNRRLEAATTL